MSGDLLIRNAAINWPHGLDVRVRGGVIVEIGRGLRGPEPVLDARGGVLTPGLIDHHIHLMALAAERASLKLGPEATSDAAAFRAALQAADRAAEPGAWVRGVGYHEAVAGPLDRAALDAIVPGRPVRVQHRTGGLWVLNSAALAAVSAAEAVADCIERDAAGTPTGRIWRGDAWLRGRIASAPPSLAAVGRELASFGIIGVTDASVTNGAAEARLFEAARASGDLRQKLMLMAGGDLPASDAYRIGPVKVLLDDDELGDLEAMEGAIARARVQGRKVAVHCVTAAQLAFALAAFDTAGAEPGDRIEHGGVIDDAARGEVARLGLTVVTQPAFIAERGDQYLAEVDPAELDFLYPCARLAADRIPIAGSSDAPYTSPDPWAAMAAAMHRESPSGVTIGERERVGAMHARNLYLGSFEDPGGMPRSVEVGAPADLCLLRPSDTDPILTPSRERVRATVIDGVVAYETGA